MEVLFKNDKRVYALLSIVGLILYGKSFFFGFTYLDDNALVLNMVPVLQNFGTLFGAFAHDVFYGMNGATAYYRPLLTLSLMPEAIMGGASPFLYHAINVAIHLTAACLVYKLFTKLKYSKIISVFVAGIFVVHPALTQAVAWIPGRNDSLLAVFVLTSFIFFINFIEDKKIGSLLGSTVFFACALFTKETALIAPVLFLAYAWTREALTRDMLIKFCAVWFLVFLVWLPLRHAALSTSPLTTSTGDMIGSVVGNLPGALQFFGKVLFPFNLSVLPTMQDTAFVWGILALACVGLTLLFAVIYARTSRKQYAMISFGLFWFLLFLLPGLIQSDPVKPVDFIEHRLYLPIIGIFIMLAESYWGRCLEPEGSRMAFAVCCGVVLLFFGITFMHENVFADPLTFWKSAAATSPHSSFAQKNLGAMYYLNKQDDLALTQYQRSLTLNPYEPMVRNNIGLIYANHGMSTEAEAAYKDEISFNPSYDAVHYNLGLLYYNTKRFSDAKKEWEKTLELNPNYGDAAQALRSCILQKQCPLTP